MDPIAEYLARGGRITRCPDAYVAPSQHIQPDRIGLFSGIREDNDEIAKQPWRGNKPGAQTRYTAAASRTLNPLPSDDELRQMRAEGMGQTAIARKFHVCRDRIRARMREIGIDTRDPRVLSPTNKGRMRLDIKHWGKIAARMLANGATMREVGEATGINEKAAADRARRLGLRSQNNRRFSCPPYRLREIAERVFAAGGTWKDVAREIGTNPRTTMNNANLHGIRAPDFKRGKGNG